MEQKRKEDKIFSKSRLIAIGLLLIIFGISLIAFDALSNINVNNLENKAIEEYYENEEILNDENDIIEDITINEEVNQTSKIEYVGVLTIPKINLKRGLVNPNSYLNDVKYNVQFLDESAMPDELYGNVILAAHSGNARVSYFKDLDKLDIEDEVVIDYNNKSYVYTVVNKYEVEKTGKVNIVRNRTSNTLTLITCIHNSSKQIVIICELVSS